MSARWGPVASALVAIACHGAPSSDLYVGDAATPESPDGSPDAAKATGVDARAPRRIDCRTAACEVGPEVCCVRGAASPATSACTAPSACPLEAAVLALPCDDARDCVALGAPGAVCCGDYVTDAQRRPRVEAVRCRDARTCTAPLARVILCGDDDSAQCSVGTHCEVSQVAIPGFRMCVQNTP